MRRFSPNSFALGFSMVFLVCPPCLECCVRLAGLVFLMSPTLWACLPACLRSCLPACLPAVLGCCVRLLACLPSCHRAGLGCCVRLLGLVSQLCDFCNCFWPAVVYFLWVCRLQLVPQTWLKGTAGLHPLL